jgi:uncharacterized phiE125 gp8 family phage protein
MLLIRTVEIADFPVSTAEAKAMAIVDHGDDDVLIDALIATATHLIGDMAGRVLASETWELSLPSGIRGDIRLPKSPIQSVTSVRYFDANDADLSVPVSNFYLTKDDDRAYLRPKSGASWPVVNGLREDALRITFVAGYSECPWELKTAIQLLVAHLYDNRTASVAAALKEIPFGVQSLVDQHKLGWIGA